MKKFVIFDLDGTLMSFRLNACHDAPLVPLTNVVSVLNVLKRVGIRIGIATNQRKGTYKGRIYDRDVIEERLTAVGQMFGIELAMIESTFDTLSPADPGWKPKPGMLLRLLSKQCGYAATTLFVGDSECDREAAANASIDFAWAWDFFAWANGRDDRSIDWDNWEKAGKSIWRVP